ncbi:hypothetical protein GCM10010435_89080 [Winogradskya consettensis]|uniref:DUF7660 domain-containing protein n=1 Tax=Winogradskya consettensis TaxID=113560 RepID=A0A919ST31_9ACTN|nr:hypothetical protein [Actinoplanes consettensis]GIM77061.1 hypothetical protein Aco04nite_53540 [Actinoplanes consettensis]
MNLRLDEIHRLPHWQRPGRRGPVGRGILDWQDPELSAVETREDLARYLEALAASLREGTISTENPSTAAFVDAAGRWTASMDGFFANILEVPVPGAPDWSMIAAIFRAALVYE